MLNCLLLVDAYAAIYRAFYAIRSLTGPQGQPVNALFGFTKMLRKQLANHRPTHCAVVFDLGAPQKRLTLLPSYKEQRPPTPPDLDSQLPAIREMLAASRVRIVEVEGEEADDLIATLAAQASDAGASVLIASNDKDFAQLVGPRIRLLRPGSDEEAVFDSAAVEARYGVRPEQMVDLLCLVGDSVDNIQGAPGVGEKTAAELLKRFGNLDNLIARASEITKPKLRATLLESTDRLRLNRDLISLNTRLKLPVTIDDLKVQRADYEKLTQLLRQFGFKSLVAELEKESAADDDLFARA